MTDIKICAEAVEKVNEKARALAESSRVAVEKMQQINNCLEWNICPLCGGTLAQIKRSFWGTIFERIRKNCLKCKAIWIEIPPTLDGALNRHEPRWAIENKGNI